MKMLYVPAKAWGIDMRGEAIDFMGTARFIPAPGHFMNFWWFTK